MTGDADRARLADTQATQTASDLIALTCEGWKAKLRTGSCTFDGKSLDGKWSARRAPLPPRS